MFYLSNIKRRNALELANHILTGDIFKENYFRGFRSECGSLVDLWRGQRVYKDHWQHLRKSGRLR